jgi:hypothetical protein
MAVTSYKELARTMEGAIGQNTVAIRRFAVILDDNQLTSPTTNTAIYTAVGVNYWGTAHPEFSFLKLRKVKLTENLGDNPYFCEVTAEYGVLKPNESLAPLSRSAEWSFEQVAGERVPALYYYDGGGNSTTYPLLNSAYDYFEGLTVEESLTQATIKQNFASRPDGIIGSFGFLNSDGWCSASAHTCKHVGSKIELVAEEWNNSTVSYWRAESNVLFRASSWNLLIPDVGFNQLVGGQKRRCMVYDFENDEWVPSPNPVGLSGGVQTNGRPDILTRRVLPATSFSGLFGSPPA